MGDWVPRNAYPRAEPQRKRCWAEHLFQVFVHLAALAGESDGPPRKLGVVGDNHPALVRGQGLAAERVGRDIPNSPDESALVFGKVGLGAVFDHRESVAPPYVHDLVHVTGVAEQVDDEDGAGALRDLALDVGGVDVERVGVHVREDRDGVLSDDA